MQQEIIDYITQAQKHGLADFEIKQNLLNAGWEAAAVEESFVYARASEGHPELPTKTQQVFAPVGATKDSHFSGITARTTEPAAINQAVIGSKKAFPDTPPKFKVQKNKFLWTAAALVFILAGSAYGYYNYVYANPAHIWQKFIKNADSSVYQTNYKVVYSDPGQLAQDTSGVLGFQLKDITLKLAGSSYVNLENPQSPEASSTIQYVFGSGNTSFSTGLQYELLQNELYLKVGDNPLLDLLSSEANDNNKIDWIKIDLSKLNSQTQASQDETKLLQQFTGADFKNQLQKIWQNASIVKVDQYLGREKINGVVTLHFKNSVDKQALKNLVSQVIEQSAKTLASAGSPLNLQDQDIINQAAGQIIDKIQIQDFETWIGLNDAKLYQVHFVSNWPSFISMIQTAQTISSAPSADPADAKRISDMQTIASALKLYFNDHQGYPDGQNGQPLNITSSYISALPQAPAASGNCTDYYNSYWYEPMGGTAKNGKTVYNSYQITFCLGAATAGYKAGVAELTPAGIININCPGDAEQCYKSGNADASAPLTLQLADFINKLQFSAQLQADFDYSDYDVKQTVSPPTDSFDLVQKFMDLQASSADAKRLADVRQIASALELYFNDKNSYPDSLGQLTPTYISALPQAPTNIGPACTIQNNAYSYVKKSSSNFSLSFCLSQETGGFSAGPHSLTPSGIQ